MTRVTVAALAARLEAVEAQLEMLLDEVVFLREYFELDDGEPWRPIVEVPGPDTYEAPEVAGE